MAQGTSDTSSQVSMWYLQEKCAFDGWISLDSGDFELDNLLNELSALQHQLDSSASDQLLLGLPTLPVQEAKPADSHITRAADVYVSHPTPNTSYEANKGFVCVFIHLIDGLH